MIFLQREHQVTTKRLAEPRQDVEDNGARKHLHVDTGCGPCLERYIQRDLQKVLSSRQPTSEDNRISLGDQTDFIMSTVFPHVMDRLWSLIAQLTNSVATEDVLKARYVYFAQSDDPDKSGSRSLRRLQNRAEELINRLKDRVVADQLSSVEFSTDSRDDKRAQAENDRKILGHLAMSTILTNPETTDEQNSIKYIKAILRISNSFLNSPLMVHLEFCPAMRAENDSKPDILDLIMSLVAELRLLHQCIEPVRMWANLASDRYRDVIRQRNSVKICFCGVSEIFRAFLDKTQAHIKEFLKTVEGYVTDRFTYIQDVSFTHSQGTLKKKLQDLEKKSKQRILDQTSTVFDHVKELKRIFTEKRNLLEPVKPLSEAAQAIYS